VEEKEEERSRIRHLATDEQVLCGLPVGLSFSRSVYHNVSGEAEKAWVVS
jgi:hypothetical protein